MACIEIPAKNDDSEMEEGEIVDELSDISSEEEFLLRQRLHVLESYNNVLERKQAKDTSKGSGNGPKQKRKVEVCDWSDVSETGLEDSINISPNVVTKTKTIKPFKRKKQSKHIERNLKRNVKERKKKINLSKKKPQIKVKSQSSDDSDDDDEFLNKRLKLANAVTLKNNKIDKSSLKDRINKMLCGSQQTHVVGMNHSNTFMANIMLRNRFHKADDDNPCVPQNEDKNKRDNIQNENISSKSKNNFEVEISKEHNNDISIQTNKNVVRESIDLCTDDDLTVCEANQNSLDVVDTALCEKVKNKNAEVEANKSDGSSDEDIEALRQHALKTKSSNLKSKPSKDTNSVNNKPSMASEDEDSDTAELRVICLKSTLLKRAIQMKQEQKLIKRLSQSSNLQDDFIMQEETHNLQSENNTDIESVDMDIGSESEEKVKDNVSKFSSDDSKMIAGEKPGSNMLRIHQEDELEEDEDLLRAKLLTSLSKNLPNLVDMGVLDSSKENNENNEAEKVVSQPQKGTITEEKKFIINLGESDSEGEHEATMNLTKMHMKLSEHYQNFQQQLDSLLKSTRKEFEKGTLPDVLQQLTLQKPAQKFVPKAMNHLPKSEQIEYKNLVKRMAELEKIKLARNSVTNSQNKTPVKETLKPRNVSLSALKSSSNLEDKIALSRKKIAEESAKVLRLKEEAKKLSQKYKIVATELRNISTAININKKQQRAVYNHLQQIRLHHQLLLKGSTTNLSNAISLNRMTSFSKIQKENDPTVKENTYSNVLKSVKVSVVNDIHKDVSLVDSRLSVQIDVANNKKVVKLPKSPPKTRTVDIVQNTDNQKLECDKIHTEDICHPVVEKGGGVNEAENMIMDTSTPTEETKTSIEVDDYRSPLAALGTTYWEEDPNAFLCPYEVGGSCRDPDCKYLHPKIPSHQ